MYMSIQCATKPIPLVHSKWILMSLNDVVQHFITKKNKNPNCQSIDFATLYDGMGFYVVCSYCIQTKAFYYRHDGGGNAYDAIYNFNFSTQCIPSPKQSFTLSRWIQDVHEEKEVNTLNVVYP